MPTRTGGTNPTTEAQLIRRTVRMHVRAAVTNMGAALAPLRERSRAREFAHTELVKHLEDAHRAAEKAARIVALWDAGEPAPDLFRGT